jgi:hypothetical protein
MNKKVVLGILLALLLVLTIPMVASAQEDEEPDLVRFTLVNDTVDPMALYLNAPGEFFYFYVWPESTRVFTVPEGQYTHTTWSCGQYASGTVDLSRQLELRFPSCKLAPANPGEPSLEKIWLGDGTPNSHWQYQID